MNMDTTKELEIVRRIRGNVHGTVDVTALEDRVIAHPMVQRLRRIKQLAFLSYVFPGATHSRFEHFLGVMQLAGFTWEKMRLNQKRLATSCGRYKDFAATEAKGVGGMVHGLLAPTFGVVDEVFNSPYALQAVRLAALLHDMGHPAFSHSGERFLPTWKELLAKVKDVPPYLIEFLQKRCDDMAAAGKDPYKRRVRHEVYTLLLVDRMLNQVNQELVKDKRQDLMIAPRDVASIISPDILPVGGSILHKFGCYKLCNELISGEVDIDRMDYLLRDSKECGVVYGIFDASRIQDSLTVYHDPSDGCMHLAIQFSGLAAFEDYLRARHSMYLQLYFHKTSVAAEAMMQHLATMLGGWTLPTDLDAYADLDEYNIEGALKAAGKAIKDDTERARFNVLLKDLLRDRKLWKRVYEVSGKSPAEIEPMIAQACDLIAGMGQRFEQISSTSSLTTFRPRRENEISRNYLRLIKKDAYQFPRVVPIEDHTTLIDGDSRVQIARVYVEDVKDAQGKSVPMAVKQLLTDKLRG